MPTETTYSYLAGDFPGSKLSPTTLKAELAASAIVTALERIDTIGGTISDGVVSNPTQVDIVYKDPLSAGDKTLLDADSTEPAGGLLGAHDNSATQPQPAGAALVLSWTALKQVATDHGLTQNFGWIQQGTDYRVWLDVGGRILESSFDQSSADGTDWETDYKDFQRASKADTGNTVVTVEDIPDGASPFRQTFTYDAPVSVTTFFDQRINGLSGPLGLCWLRSGKYRVRGSATVNSSLGFSVVDRDDATGLFGAVGLTITRLSGLTGISGTFEVGEAVTGTTSSAVGTIIEVGGGYLGIRADFTGTFSDGESLTGGTSGATATLGTYEEGDVLPLAEIVADEWVEGDNEWDEIRFGGVKKLYAGWYFRTKIYNADDTNNLRIKVALDVGKE